MTIPRGILLANPGNIRRSGEVWNGEVPSDDRSFKRFDSMTHGARAAAKIILNYQRIHHIDTIAGLIHRWAPPVENNTASYASFVAFAAAHGVDDVLPQFDSTLLSAVMQAIFRMEQGKRPDGIWWVPDDLGRIGAEAALRG